MFDVDDWINRLVKAGGKIVVDGQTICPSAPCPPRPRQSGMKSGLLVIPITLGGMRLKPRSGAGPATLVWDGPCIQTTPAPEASD